MNPYASLGRDGDNAVLYLGRMQDALPHLPENSVDAVVTDPPYELAFMGKAWDASGVAFDPETWRHVLRVLKPGGHLLVFGGTRTYHRMACAIEDAGFEVRDQMQFLFDADPLFRALWESLDEWQRDVLLRLLDVMGFGGQLLWLYGSGFPKSLDVSKAIDKAAGVERERVPYSGKGIAPGHGNYGGSGLVVGEGSRAVNNPVTEAAQQWQGWGTALKPANEPICLARKPLVGTVAANVLEYGAGALNIDACRIDAFGRPHLVADPKASANGAVYAGRQKPGSGFDGGSKAEGTTDLGRWPANVLLDETAAAMLDEQSGTTTSGRPVGQRGSGGILSSGNGVPCGPQYGDTGGASRFFYTAKPSKAERNAGGAVQNTHATVKPVDLMAYLIRLITPPGGTVLDPFMGSGTTAMAALQGGWRFIGVELLEEHAAIAAARLWQENSVAYVGLGL
jgi:hypothetical protein